MLKRLFDIVASLCGLVVLSPFIIVFSVIIALTDGFPIIFFQRRVGLSCKMFTMYKFRTMKTVSLQVDIADLGDNSRVTKIGAILRKTKFDEVPQLFNVLKGDMSIVGPRPELKSRLQYHKSHWKKVYSVRPGITGNSSIIYRNEEELLSSVSNPQQYYIDVLLPKKIVLYEDYVDNRSFWYDIKIIFKTIGAMLGKSYEKI